MLFPSVPRSMAVFMKLRIPPIQEDKGGKKKAIFIASWLYYPNKFNGSLICLNGKSVLQYAHVLGIKHHFT